MSLKKHVKLGGLKGHASFNITPPGWRSWTAQDRAFVAASLSLMPQMAVCTIIMAIDCLLVCVEHACYEKKWRVAAKRRGPQRPKSYAVMISPVRRNMTIRAHIMELRKLVHAHDLLRENK